MLWRPGKANTYKGLCIFCYIFLLQKYVKSSSASTRTIDVFKKTIKLKISPMKTRSVIRTTSN